MIDNFLKDLNKKTLIGSNYQINNARLTLDYKEDYLLFNKIREKLEIFVIGKKLIFF